VTTNTSGRSVVYEVEVAEEDLGQVIGRRGRTANALRTIVGSVRKDDGTRHTIEIMS